MRPIRPLLRLWLIHWYRWAQREIHPLHPDLPYIVRRLHQLEMEQPR